MPYMGQGNCLECGYNAEAVVVYEDYRLAVDKEILRNLESMIPFVFDHVEGNEDCTTHEARMIMLNKINHMIEIINKGVNNGRPI